MTATGNKSEKRLALKQGVSKVKIKRDSFVSDVCCRSNNRLLMIDFSNWKQSVKKTRIKRKIEEEKKIGKMKWI